MIAAIMVSTPSPLADDGVRVLVHSYPERLPPLHTYSTYLQPKYPLLSTFIIMTVKESIVHDTVNLIHLVWRLDKSINEADWGTGCSSTQWLKSETTGTCLKIAGNHGTSQQDSTFGVKLVKRLADIHGLLNKLDASMLSVNERVAPEGLNPRIRNPDLPTIQRLALSSLRMRRPSAAAAAATDVGLLLGSTD
ncbi:hypothetical protein EDB87DRAFT_1579788 [Lactarius vividus]|nr:hypothetical protein EDB87DRAFT_1579788 [Lactarius vividus]